MTVKIELRTISVSFPFRGRVVPAVRDVTLQVNDGEFVTIIGPSGCGKSTLFNVTSGLIRPDSGRVFLDGEDVTGHRGLVSYMPQKDLLFPWRTVLDNVVLGLEVQGVGRAEARRKAVELTPFFGLAGFEHNYPAALSGGMRQRAALLRTFLCRSDVMLLDEPFGALDALTRFKMQTWLLDAWERFRHSVLFITHDIDEAIFLSDRVYILTERPARVKLEVEVELPRPRPPQLVTGPAFIAMKETIMGALSEQGTRSEHGHIENCGDRGREAEGNSGVAF